MSDASDRYTSRTKTLKNTALGIANMAAEKISANHDKKGILLCEGKETSFDKVLYSAVYQQLWSWRNCWKHFKWIFLWGVWNF